jgi:hypothetical protein
MTPKEKAKELYNKGYNLSNGPTLDDARQDGKDIAMIVVDEIINSKPTSGSGYDYVGNGWDMDSIIINEVEYWYEVKKEIELL